MLMSVLGLAAQRSPLQVEALRWVALWWVALQLVALWLVRSESAESLLWTQPLPLALMRLLGQVLPCSQE